jgi:hypothetical protein
VRRAVVLALTAGLASTLLVALTGATASAHICPVPAQIPVGSTASVNVGVTVEQATVPDVEITVPAALRIDRVDPLAGWSFVHRGSVVRYRGGPILPYTCKYFSLRVTATVSGAFGIAVVQRDVSGKVVAHSTPDPSSAQSRLLDQFVYAGVKPPSPGGSTGPSVAVIAGVALVIVGVVAVGFLAWRSRRRGEEDDEGEDADSGADRDAELRARLDRFRTRAPDRTPGR